MDNPRQDCQSLAWIIHCNMSKISKLLTCPALILLIIKYSHDLVLKTRTYLGNKHYISQGDTIMHRHLANVLELSEPRFLNLKPGHA